MFTGTVKWFDANKGFGFISGDDGADTFVHYTAIEGKGYRSLTEGDKVEYEKGRGEKGEKATNVRVTQPVQPGANNNPSRGRREDQLTHH